MYVLLTQKNMNLSAYYNPIPTRRLAVFFSPARRLIGIFVTITMY